MTEEIMTEYLKCPLTETEMKKEAEKMANCFSKLSELEGVLKSAKKQIESDIARVEAELTSSVEKYRSGFEMRNIECRIDKDFQTNTVRTIRLDTNEMIRERALTSEERQMEMDLTKEEIPAIENEADLPDRDVGDRFYNGMKGDGRTT
jgi:hypothetical protein